MTHLTADDLAALADEAGVTRLQVERMERAGYAVFRKPAPGTFTGFYGGLDFSISETAATNAASPPYG